MIVKKGNTVKLVFAIKDSNDDVVTNLATAVKVKFMVKENKTDLDSAAVISKSLGAGITVDDPATGDISVILTDTDTDISVTCYFFALQIEYATEIYELNSKEDDQVTSKFQIIQDIILSTG